MKRIFKYEVPVGDHLTIMLPKGAKLLHFASQHRESPQGVLWALVDPEAEYEERYFRCAGTGHPIEEDNPKHLKVYLGE